MSQALSPRPLPAGVAALLTTELLNRFERYVRIFTTSGEDAPSKPSTARQLDLLRLLADECRALKLCDVDLDSDAGFLYATLPAQPAYATAEPFALLAHVDTSPEQPGAGVEPVRHLAWNGEPITFRDDPTLTLSLADSPELERHLGDTIITAAGRTLLGADNKAGVAEIMCAVAALQRYPELPHGEIRLVFTTDEEVGHGVQGIDLKRLPPCCYTVDGGEVGELQAECFDAWAATITLVGKGVHPGTAKNRLVNAVTAAARLIASLPREETPERTAGREGFFYVYDLQGTVERADIKLIVRDFDAKRNANRLARLTDRVHALERETPGLLCEINTRQQYTNMAVGIATAPQTMSRARAAYRDTGIVPIEKPIRGGTDGSQLTALGHPTPNLFTGGHLYHSRKEWVALGGMVQAATMLLHLARRWTEPAAR
jgi:tripeptide aminopeptidase